MGRGQTSIERGCVGENWRAVDGEDGDWDGGKRGEGGGGGEGGGAGEGGLDAH